MQKIISKALICGFIISVVYSFTNFTSNCENISKKIFRLHIIANSDSCEDQNVKLRVRDRILKDFSYSLSNLGNLSNVEKSTKENLENIKETAIDEIKKNGFNYDVDAKLVNMYFDNRKYENLTIPSGFYDALRIEIGECKGKNWWCVMFPPMCIPTAEGNISKLDSVLNDSEIDIIERENQYKIQFKIIEMYANCKNIIGNMAEKLRKKSNTQYDADIYLRKYFNA